MNRLNEYYEGVIHMNKQKKQTIENSVKLYRRHRSALNKCLGIVQRRPHAYCYLFI